MLAASLTLLSPRAALVGVPALLAVGAAVYGVRRADTVRRVLHLPPPGPGGARARVALVAAVVALLALTAAQPALTRNEDVRTRRDAQVLFVVDVSRSMAASSGPNGATRLDRAAAAAARLRAEVPTVAAGVATLTDRVLPALFPVPQGAGFDGVLRRGLAIENPPPQRSAARATSFDALAQIPGNGFFDPKARRRIAVVLTDGESGPVRTGDVASAFAGAPGFETMFVRVWQPGESIYDADGRREDAYRSDPSSEATVDSLASALGARSFDEGSLDAAGRELRRLAGEGPTTTSPGTVRTLTPLAPYTAALALLATLAVVVTRRVPWFPL